jgi:hypothetical protein
MALTEVETICRCSESDSEERRKSALVRQATRTGSHSPKPKEPTERSDERDDDGKDDERKLT